MKRFALWLASAVTLYAALAAGWHLYLERNPHHLAVVVDASYPMQRDWERTRAQLEAIGERRYTHFALITDKGLQHSWQPTLQAERVTPYAPRDLAALEQLTGSLEELQRADEVILVSNAERHLLQLFSDWVILSP